MNCSPPGFSVHGISRARIPEWVAISFSRGSSLSRDWTHVSCTGRWILHHWATRCPKLTAKPWGTRMLGKCFGLASEAWATCWNFAVLHWSRALCLLESLLEALYHPPLRKPWAKTLWFKLSGRYSGSPRQPKLGLHVGSSVRTTTHLACITHECSSTPCMCEDRRVGGRGTANPFDRPGNWGSERWRDSPRLSPG